MDALNLPEFDCKLTEIDGKPYIFDVLRRKHVRLTPEEWVRQHVVNLLVGHYNYPRTLIRAEGGVVLNATNKRTDLLTFRRDGSPYLLVECKASTVALTQAVFDQVARYNFVHKAPFLVITNGLTHYCCQLCHQTAAVTFLADFPHFAE